MNTAGRLHLFSGFENKMLGITPDMELGHLYDWRNDILVLKKLGKEVGMKSNWMQVDDATNFWHFDLWGKPLEKARQLFRIVGDLEFANDLAGFARTVRKEESNGL